MPRALVQERRGNAPSNATIEHYKSTLSAALTMLSRGKGRFHFGHVAMPMLSLPQVGGKMGACGGMPHASSATGQRTNLEHEKSPNELRAGNTRMSGSLAQRYVVRWRARFAR